MKWHCLSNHFDVHWTSKLRLVLAGIGPDEFIERLARCVHLVHFNSMQMRAFAHGLLIWRVARWLEWPPPPPQIRLKVLVAGLFPLQKLNNFIDKRSTEMFSSNFSTHTVVTPLAQHFCRDKSQQMLTKSEFIFWEIFTTTVECSYIIRIRVNSKQNEDERKYSRRA